MNKMNLIRKITIGKDYKNDAMHYSVGQEVYGGHVIHSILAVSYTHLTLPTNREV